MARILVIEDNPLNLELLTDLLEAWGHRTLVATDGDAGLELLKRERPDLVLCDLQMPGRDGYGVAAAIRADPALRALPLVAVTAFAMVGDRERALDAGFDAHISKPIDPRSFVAEIERHLQRSVPPVPASAVVSDPPPPLPASLRAPFDGARLLMVDDEPVNQEFKRHLLEPAGYRVHTAAGAQEALDVLRREGPFDLVMSDVVMPGGSGFSLLQAMRADAALAGVPLVFLTSTARDAASRAHGLALGARRYLLRPVEPIELLAQIREVLAGR